MGYDIHITRKELWFDEEGPIITAEEWLAYVATDAQLKLVPNDANHKVILNIKSPLIREPWLIWRNGGIETKNPDEWLIAKMLLIASELNARVQGDDGELYHRGIYQDYIAAITQET